MYESEKEMKIDRPELNVKFHIIPKSLSTPFSQHFPGYKTGLVCGEPGKFVMTPSYGSNAEILYRMQPRNDNVWILTFPKCGKYMNMNYNMN